MNTAKLDPSIQVLQAHKHEWANLPISQKVDLLLQSRKNIRRLDAAWVDAAVRCKQIEQSSPWVGEEWVTGPWALAAGMDGYLDTLRALAQGRLPRLQKVTTRSNGQVVATVFPNTLLDRLILSGITARVWMQPGVTESNLGEHMAPFYKQKNPEGKVALVLGAGNVNSIAPLDALYRLYVLGHVVLLKSSPINDYQTPILQNIFAPLIERGYLQIASGGAEVGEYLTHHAGIEEIHITGNQRTHDAIVFGSGPEGAERKRNMDPQFTKPLTSELGGVCPTIVVPGRWTKADIRYQAENVITSKLHNGGFNCAASQVLILWKGWDQHGEFMEAIRKLMRDLPPRQAYYPGAAERQKQALAFHPEAEHFGSEVPRTLITGLDPAAAQEHCFNTELFGAVFAQTSLPGKDAAEYLSSAVRFCNEKLHGTLGATLIAHPTTIKELGPGLEQAVADLRYGSVGINIWSAIAFLLAQTTWGGYPGQTADNIQSGRGVVRNSFMFDKPEKTVTSGSFYPFPRSWLHGDPSLLPRPPWFVTNKTAPTTARRVARFAADPGDRHLPGIFVSALRG